MEALHSLKALPRVFGYSVRTQAFPPKPSVAATSVDSQVGKVFLVTGGSSGVGFQLCSLLYAAGAKVYIAGRSEQKAQAAMAEIKQAHQELKKTTDSIQHGNMIFLKVDLSDLSSIAPAVAEFLKQESHLDILWNNAGIFQKSPEGRSAQGISLQFAAHCVGPYLFTKLLLPALKRATKPRVVWTGSNLIDLAAPKGGMRESDYEQPGKNGTYNYTVSKVGNWFLASHLGAEEGTRRRSAGPNDEAIKSGTGECIVEGETPLVPVPVLHVCVNPGNLLTPMIDDLPLLARPVARMICHEPIYGSYSQLWAGLSPELDVMRDQGVYIIPWGRKHPSPRADILKSLKGESDGGKGMAAKFAQWCEEQTAAYRE